jgi:molecular chaperone GrpE
MTRQEHPDKPHDTPMEDMPGDKAEKETDETLEPDNDENAEPSELEAERDALQSRFAEMQDKYLRLAAEFDNYRKRTLREKSELIQTAGESLLKDILPVMDDFERGLDVIDKSNDMKAIKTGIGLIYTKLKDFMESNGVREIKAINESFDADRHEAVTNIPAPSEDMAGKVTDVIQKGYTLHDKIIRYPKVVVGE